MGPNRLKAITWTNNDPVHYIIKTHVRGFFDTDLHEFSWHFALSSTDRVKISVKEAIQNGFLFLSHT